jgi:hypothetical protein
MGRLAAITTGALLTFAFVPGSASAKHTRGLSLHVDDGVGKPVQILGNDWRYVDELDIVAVAHTETDEGIAPLSESGDLANLDWSGVMMVDEEWRPDGQGTFTRQRFYRHATWMDEPSVISIIQLDDEGKPLPVLPHFIYTGADDLWSGFDGGVVRRFSARHITTGCTAVDDCDAATGYTAQGLMQLRHSQNPLLDARRIHRRTAKLLMIWSADPLNPRVIPVENIKKKDVSHAEGFSADFEVVTPPANGVYYEPGEAITFRALFTDGEGNPLDDDGELPTYADYLFGGTASGLRYFDILLDPTLYYALKHREGNLTFAMGGPTDALAVTDYTVPLEDFFLPQIPAAFAAEHGFSSVVTGIPPFSVILGGALFDPSIWNTPVPTDFVMTVPEDALPGTYVVALKARREFAGEAINTGAVHRIQVGTAQPTSWEPTTGNCQTCHSGPAALGNILHGFADRESCLSGCHTSLANEPDAALDYRVHFVHTRSNRYPANPDDCSVCHFDEPEGIPRGYPGFVWPFE